MFEALFKFPLEVWQQGQLVFEGAHDAALTLAVAAAACALLGASLLRPGMRGLAPGRRWLIGGLETAFVAVALLALARPALQIATLTPGVNQIAIVLDTSQSMGLPDDAGSPSRLSVATTVVRDRLMRALDPLGEVTTYTLGETARRETFENVVPEASRSRIVRGLEDVLAGYSGAPLAAVILLSDGADNGSQLDLGPVRIAGVPIHTIGFGPSQIQGDVELVDVRLPTDASPDTRIVADILLRHQSAGTATLRVRDGSRLIAREDVVLHEGARTQRVALAFDSGAGGIRELNFDVAPPEGDPLPGNNRRQRLLTVREQQRRLLYLEGEPRWEYKFIRRALAGDDLLVVRSWLRTTENKSFRQDVGGSDELAGGFPESLVALYEYDVVVLGSLAATELSDDQHAWLERFVAERGGSLLALGGRYALADGGWDARPLADALPVSLLRAEGGTYHPGEARVRIAAAGRQSPVTQLLVQSGEGGDPWSSLPPLADYQRLGPLKPAATPLLEVLRDGVAQPLLVTQNYGHGTAMVLATASTWRWQMRTPVADNRHTVFWRQLLRHLAGSAPSRREVSVMDREGSLDMRLMARDARFAPRSGLRASVTLSGPGIDGVDLDLQPGAAAGEYRAGYDVAEPGIYRVDVRVDAAAEEAAETITRFLRVGEERPEYFDAARNEGLLRQLADETGGAYWQPTESAAIARQVSLEGAGVRHLERRPVWDMPALFLLLVLLKASEWLFRRRWGRL